jgi:hypothetical protein
MSNRITYNIPEPPKEGYEAFLFHIQLWDEKKKMMMNYGGRRMEQFKRGYSDVYSYFSSAPEEQMDYILELFAFSKKVIVTITKYDDKFNIGYGESKMLRDAVGIDEHGGEVKGAAASVDWINQTNGGGLYTQGYTIMQRVYALFDRAKAQVDSGKNDKGEYLLKGEFETGISKKDKIEKMLHPSNLIQCRNEMFDPEYVELYIYDINQDSNPKKYPPLIEFEAKDPNDLNKVTSGHHWGKACVRSERGHSLTHIKLPYSEWKFMLTADNSDVYLRAYGKLWNPESDMPRKKDTPESVAQFLLDFCEQENLTKIVTDPKTDKKEVVWNYKHDACIDFLKRMKFKGPRQETVFHKAQILVENEKLRLKGDYLMDWSDKALAQNPALLKEYNDKKAAFKKSCDWVYKISSRFFSNAKIQQEAWRNDYKKRGLVWVYHPALEDDKIWRESTPTPKEGLITCSIKWEKDKKEFFNQYEIDTLYLPVKKSQAIALGWKSVK